MKKILSIILAVLMLASLAACGGNSPSDANETQTAEEQGEPSENTGTEPEGTPSEDGSSPDGSSQTPPEDADPASDDTAAHPDVLVAYFSATGTTKGVAEKIAAITGGDLYEILPAEPYTADDLNYNDRNSRSTKEQDDKNARPGIKSEEISLEGYTTVYLGFPIWWGEEPSILDTFVEKYSFDGITVIPFCTSASSGIGRSGPNMEALAGSGTWLDGKRFGGSVSEADLRSWIEGLR